MSDSYDWTMADISPFQSGSLVHQSSASIVSEPSMLSDYLRYNDSMQHPFAYVAPGFDVSLASGSTFSNFFCFDPNHIHQTPNDDGCAPTATTIGYLNPMHDATCTNLLASTLSVQKSTQPKASSNGDAKGKRAHAHSQAHRQKQGTAQISFQCRWKDCTYPTTFAGKPALMRHINTQHIDPGSFYCPLCTRSFNRKDNMNDHIGKIHQQRFQN